MITDTNENNFPCAVCGAPDADWDENADSLRCPKHHQGGRDIDRERAEVTAHEAKT